MAIPIETTESNVDENMSTQVSADLCIDYLKVITSDLHFIIENLDELDEGFKTHTKEIEDLKTKVDDIAIKVDAMDAKLDKIIDMLLKR
jgi:hypothetical protein